MTNAIQEKKPIEFYRSDPSRYRELKSGSFQDVTTGRIVATFDNPYAITSELSQQFHAKARAKKARSKLKGLADAAIAFGANFPDPDTMTDEELIEAAGDMVRQLTKQLSVVFMSSSNVRGLSESYNKLVDALAAEPTARDTEPPPPVGEIRIGVETLLELSRQIEERTAAERDKARALDAGGI